jgi:hypothetical protein
LQHSTTDRRSTIPSSFSDWGYGIFVTRLIGQNIFRSITVIATS